MKNATVMYYIAGTCLAAYLAGGFLLGMIHLDYGEGLLSNTIGRVFGGFIGTTMCALNGGFYPRSFATDVPPINAWPYIFLVWSVLQIPLVKSLRNHSR